MNPIGGFVVRLGVTLLFAAFTVLPFFFCSLAVELIFKFIHPDGTHCTLGCYFAFAYRRWFMWAAWN
jgi:hypothetical protein